MTPEFAGGTRGPEASPRSRGPDPSDETSNCLDVDSAGRYLYWCDTQGRRIIRTDAVSGANTTLATLDDFPNGLALDPQGSVYVALSFSVLRIDSSGGIAVIAPESFGLNYLAAIDVGSDGNLYVADSANDRILKLILDRSSSRVVRAERIAGAPSPNAADKLPALSAGLLHPGGLAFGASGDLYFVEGGSVRRIDRQSRAITTVGGACPSLTGPGGDGRPAEDPLLSMVYGTAVDSAGNFYVADAWNHRICRVDASGAVTTVVSNLASPRAVAMDGAGSLYSADAGASRILRVNPQNLQVTTVLSGDAVSYPTGVAVDGRGVLFVADARKRVILRVSPSGETAQVAGGDENPMEGEAQIRRGCKDPCPILLASGGDTIYFLDYASQRIARLTSEGTETILALDPTREAVSLAAGGGSVYFADLASSTIQRIPLEGTPAPGALAALLNEVNRTYRSVKNFHAEARIVERSNDGRSELTATAATFLQAPGKVRIEAPSAPSGLPPSFIGVFIGNGGKFFRWSDVPPGYQSVPGDFGASHAFGRYPLVYDRLPRAARLLKDETIRVAVAAALAIVSSLSAAVLVSSEKRNSDGRPSGP